MSCVIFAFAVKMVDQECLKSVYYSPENPGSFGGKERLQRGLLETKGLRMSDKKLTEWLSGEDTYTLHKTARVNFKRNKVFVSNIDAQWQADLVDMSSLSQHNDKVKFMLTCIDVLSKFAWVCLLKNKSGKEVTRAFQDILAQGRRPKKLQTDKGTEFFNKDFQKLMKQYQITHFATSNDKKASVVERFNRTLKTRMWRYFNAHNTHKYIDIIQHLVLSYNNSYHSTIKMKPVDVNEANAFNVFKTIYGPFPKRLKKQKFKFEKGDTVRISKVRGTFAKGYEQTYTDEYFTVAERVHRIPPVYKLKDCDGDDIEGTFYEAELQRVTVSKDKTFKVEKIIAQKRVKGKKLVLVKWVGWPEKFNSWIPASHVVDI